MKNLNNSTVPKNTIFDMSKIEYTSEVFDEKDIMEIKESFDSGFESTLKFVKKGKTIIIIDQFTRKIEL